MNPRRVTDPLVRDSPVLAAQDTVETGVRALLDTDLPALPVADPDGHFCGIFGEREFFAALFPGYLGQLHGAGFVTRSIDATLEKRATCRNESVGSHANTDHIDVGPDFSDAQVAETFLHHCVLILPVVDDGRVLGVITRGDFVHALAERWLAGL
jgi:CBS domain-containing protein